MRKKKELKKVIEFFMPMSPPTSTHQLKQVRVVSGKPQFYEPPKVADARAKLTAHLTRHRPEAPMEGALTLHVKWCFQNTQGHHHGTWRATKPDTDNINKLLKDCMTTLGFWNDDAQVAQEIIEKFWWDTPGIFIRIAAL